MAIVKWTPFRELENMFDEMDSFFLPVAQRGFTPAMDIYEDDDNVVAEVSVPKMDPENIDVTVEDNVLTVSGQTRHEETEEDKKKGYFRKEVRSGSFRRSVQLPAAVQGDKAKASYEDGMLKITMPKAEHIKPKKINVEVKEK